MYCCSSGSISAASFSGSSSSRRGLIVALIHHFLTSRKLVATDPPVPCSQQFLAASRTASRSRATLWRRSTRRAHPVERKGFHVACTTDLDCFSRCGSALRFKHLIQSSTALLSELARSFVPGHPVTGMHYVCTPKPELYTHGGPAARRRTTAARWRSADVAAQGRRRAARQGVAARGSTNEDYYLLEEARRRPVRQHEQRGHGRVHRRAHTTTCTRGAWTAPVGAQVDHGRSPGCSGEGAPGGPACCCGSRGGHRRGLRVRAWASRQTQRSSTRACSWRRRRSTASGAAAPARAGTTSSTAWTSATTWSATRATRAGCPRRPACALCGPPCPSNIGETLVKTVTAVRALGYDIVSAHPAGGASASTRWRACARCS